MLQELIEEKKPVGETETHLVERIAFHMIRIRRARLLEADFLTNRSTTRCSRRYERSVKAKVRTQRDLVETVLRTYRRYESIFTARLIKVLRELETLQQLRNGEAVPALNVQIDGGEDKDSDLPPSMIQEAHEVYVGAHTTT